MHHHAGDVVFAAAVFGRVLTLYGAADGLATWMTGISADPTVFLIIVILIYLALGCMLEMARLRHGDMAVVRALARRERAVRPYPCLGPRRGCPAADGSGGRDHAHSPSRSSL